MSLHLSLLRVDQLFSKVVVLMCPSINSRWMFLCPLLQILDILGDVSFSNILYNHPGAPHFPQRGLRMPLPEVLQCKSRYFLSFFPQCFDFSFLGSAIYVSACPSVFSLQSLVVSLIFSLFWWIYAFINP